MGNVKYFGFVAVLAAALTSSGQNLVQNPGFEQGTTAWHVHDNFGRMDTTTAFPHSGQWAGICYRTEIYGGPQQSLLNRLQPNTPYLCSGWVRVQNGTGENVKMTFRWKDASPDDHYYNFPSGTAYSNSWTYLSGTFSFTPVGTLTELVLFFEGPAAGVDLLVDDVSVVPLWPPPGVNLTVPTNGTRSLTGTNLLLNASVTLTGGQRLTNVEFYANGRLLGRRTTAPYSLVWSNVPSGTYYFTAKANDQLGQTGVSATANVVVVPESAPVSFFPGFANTSGLWLRGDSQVTSNRLRLTPGQGNRLGAVWLLSRQMVQNGFQTTFLFQATNSGGAEGLAFVLQDQDLPLLGRGGSGLGYEGLSNSLAIEFDLRQSPEQADPDDNHVSVHCSETNANMAFEATTMGRASLLTNLSDGAVHSVTLRYVPGKLQVFVDNPTNSVLSLPLRLEQLLHLEQGRAWVGLTASTSAGNQNQDLLLWSFWPNLPPTVRLLSPQDHQSFAAPALVQLGADAADADGRAVWVDYYANGCYLGSANIPPYDLVWSQVPAGDYELNAQAVDETGAVADFGPVRISVLEPPRVQVVLQPDRTVVVEFSTLAGRNYGIQYSQDLKAWQTVASVIAGTGNVYQWHDTIPPVMESLPSRFYRVQLLP